ncbi:MAG: substrate-binding domain-containing protein, partial [Clostridiales bacterium]|nr:substrate-binding domain-containing protein [Clostridiales bacterium]
GGDAEPSGDAPAASDNAPAGSTVSIGSREWYETDDYDHFGREPFKISYMCNYLTWVWNKAISDTFGELGKVLNYDYTPYACNGDFDAYINQIYTYADQGYEGFIIGANDELAIRAYEVCQELNVAFVAESTSFLDENGNCIWSSVQQAQYLNGAACAEWLADNYKNYWSDPIDTSKLGLLVLSYSPVTGIHEREPGAREAFLKSFPEAEANYYVGDLVTYGSAGFSVQGGNDMTTSILSTHPEVEHWFVVANVDDWATGATRAVESMQMEDRVLVVSVQADAFLKEMESGYTGNVYVAANAVSSTEFALYMAANLVTILEGRATAETIWPEWIPEGSSYPKVELEGYIITRDTYKEYLAAQTVPGA